MKCLGFIPFLFLLGNEAIALSPEDCTGKKCFCMSALGAAPVCVETKKTREDIKADLLAAL